MNIATMIEKKLRVTYCGLELNGADGQRISSIAVFKGSKILSAATATTKQKDIFSEMSDGDSAVRGNHLVKQKTTSAERAEHRGQTTITHPMIDSRAQTREQNKSEAKPIDSLLSMVGCFTRRRPQPKNNYVMQKDARFIQDLD